MFKVVMFECVYVCVYIYIYVYINVLIGTLPFKEDSLIHNNLQGANGIFNILQMIS